MHGGTVWKRAKTRVEDGLQDQSRRWTHVAWPLPAVSSPSTTLLRSSGLTSAMAVSAAFESVKGVGTSLILMKESCRHRGEGFQKQLIRHIGMPGGEGNLRGEIFLTEMVSV